MRVRAVSIVFGGSACGEGGYAVSVTCPAAGRVWLSHLAAASPLAALLVSLPPVLPALRALPSAAAAAACRVAFAPAVSMRQQASFAVRAYNGKINLTPV
jgi:hypothetical protein